ncbi:MAG: PAS domain-containing protein [Nitrospinaceae bacterium]|nr:PAS domain-containing protein [Nitrospinaceae bacterium]NIR54832.1 PAS domain-containing protein [Nitrospinaceae bacterium]NIS85257.1 PAS domain-containing protein [Nitrospinaceae bacterium]NIT82070.1 PAS domain-containing protein [Nitrospinaceae bacterium]NIU44331.1 PAS domain-containing protein [Nitrospinaceae bacterium]
MFKKSLHRQLFISYLLITLFSLGAIGGYTIGSLRDFYYEQTSSDLVSRARLVEEEVRKYFSPSNARELERLAQVFGQAGNQRVTFILPEGTVLGDSDKNPAEMDNHSNRPEVQQALQGKGGSSIRYSDTLEVKLMYQALPVYLHGELAGVVRLSIPLTVIDNNLKGMLWKIFFAGLIIALVAAFVSLKISRRISDPLSTMKKYAESIAVGEWDAPIRVEGPEDVVSLGQALNEMAAQLDDRIRTITAQRNEQEAILASMVEGVIAVNSGETLISLNRAAAKLLSVDFESARGKPLPAVVRNLKLQEFVRNALSGEGTLEDDLVIQKEGEEHYLQTVGMVLHDSHKKPMGAVIVLNDVTRLKRLETMRRDFVANVSHELRTPITSIKGFVETMLGGPLEDPQDHKRFLEIVAGQTDRLNAIIEDLLSLAQLEGDSQKRGIDREICPLQPILELATEICRPKAKDKNIQVNLDVTPGLTAIINPNLIEQALVNLVDNAIKYSPDGAQVNIRGFAQNAKVTLEVSDTGRGIPSEHLPRLFERFYRVDADRSRRLGGTGLGLAIVKHIAQIHRGSVSVTSEVGSGSTFKIHLPLMVTPDS